MNASEITAAAYIFEKERSFTLAADEHDLILECGFENMSGKEIGKMIIDFICSELNIPVNLRTTSYWALGKKYDNSYLGFLKNDLK